MSAHDLAIPDIDPTPIFEHFRGSYGSELLTTAVAHFNVFGALAEGPLQFGRLRERLGLAERPAMVLLTALRAMGLLATNQAGELIGTSLVEEHLTPGARFDVSDYVGLAATSPGVLEMVQRLRSNKPAGLGEDDEGAAFIYRQGVRSAMEQSELARHFTLALSGRAKNVAPVLASKVAMRDAEMLLDVGCGTGIYSIELLRRHPHLRAIALDRPEVLKITDQFASEYGVADRLRCAAGDMFVDPLPQADVVLLSNVLHDWDVNECRLLVERCASALMPGGRLLIHDVLLSDEHDGPLPVALYSAALFTLTEGRAYSQAEFQGWMREAGLALEPTVETLVHCSVLTGRKSLG